MALITDGVDFLKHKFSTENVVQVLKANVDPNLSNGTPYYFQKNIFKQPGIHNSNYIDVQSLTADFSTIPMVGSMVDAPALGAESSSFTPHSVEVMAGKFIVTADDFYNLKKNGLESNGASWARGKILNGRDVIRRSWEVLNKDAMNGAISYPLLTKGKVDTGDKFTLNFGGITTTAQALDWHAAGTTIPQIVSDLDLQYTILEGRGYAPANASDIVVYVPDATWAYVRAKALAAYKTQVVNIDINSINEMVIGPYRLVKNEMNYTAYGASEVQGLPDKTIQMVNINAQHTCKVLEIPNFKNQFSASPFQFVVVEDPSGDFIEVKIMTRYIPVPNMSAMIRKTVNS